MIHATIGIFFSFVVFLCTTIYLKRFFIPSVGVSNDVSMEMEKTEVIQSPIREDASLVEKSMLENTKGYK